MPKLIEKDRNLGWNFWGVFQFGPNWKFLAISTPYKTKLTYVITYPIFLLPCFFQILDQPPLIPVDLFSSLFPSTSQISPAKPFRWVKMPIDAIPYSERRISSSFPKWHASSPAHKSIIKEIKLHNNTTILFNNNKPHHVTMAHDHNI